MFDSFQCRLNIDSMLRKFHNGGSWASFCILTICECEKFKQMVGFECPHHLMVSLPLSLNTYNDKVLFVGPCHLPKFWDNKPKETVGVSPGYTDHYQGRDHSIRPTATVINIHEHLI